MAAFVEALLKERLWYWLETEEGMVVDGEVNLGTGRIDLVAKTPDGEVWGVELKSGSGVGMGSTLYDQAHRYIDSGALDRIFFASHQVDSLQKTITGSPKPNVSLVTRASKRLAAGVSAGDYSEDEVMTAVERELPNEFLTYQVWGTTTIREHIESKLGRPSSSSASPVELSDGIAELRRSRCPTELGIIHVPLNLQDGMMHDVEKNISPAQAYEPYVLREADQLSSSKEPSFARREEPWIRHCVWREYGGLPEGHVPNVMESDRPHRPIDLLSFPESPDPTATVRSPERHEVVGIEAKGESSYSPDRVTTQLSEFLETETLSRLYLAVPNSITGRAAELISETDELERVGVLGVDEGGEVSVARQATVMTPQHDGYLDKYSERKVGWGTVELEDGLAVESPFVTDEEAERLKYSDAAAYAQGVLTDNSSLADDDGWISANLPRSLRPPESEYDKNDKARAYLFKGKSADPYTEGGSPPVEANEMKPGYVRLTLTDFEVGGEVALKLHFGRGSWEGGYNWLVGDQIQQLKDILVSLETIAGGAVPGQGKVIDLETFPFAHEENKPHRLSGSYGTEEPLLLRIYSADEAESFGRIRLGESSKAGVDVEFTKLQWYDLVASVDILQTGTQRELPGEYGSYPRIGPNGDDTWGHGTEIETKANPDSLE